MKRFLLSAALPVAVLLLALVPLACADGKSSASAKRLLIKTSMGNMTVELWPDVAPRTVASFIGLANGRGTFKDNRSGRDVKITKPFFDGLAFHRVIKGFMLQGGCPRGDGMGDPGYQFDDEMNAKALGLDKEMVLTGGRPHKWIQGMGPRYWQQSVVLPVLKSMGINRMDQAEVRRREPEVLKKMESMSLMELYVLQGYKYDGSLPSKKPEKYTLAMANSGPNTNGSQFFINISAPLYLTGRHTVFGKLVSGMDVADKIGAVKVGAGAKPVVPVKIISIRSID